MTKATKTQGKPYNRGKSVLMTKVCESGRSMVEMLGVLMIMGMLALLAIVGFKILFNYWYAYEIREAVGEAKLLVETKKAVSHRLLSRFIKKSPMNKFAGAFLGDTQNLLRIMGDPKQIDKSIKYIITLQKIPDDVQDILWNNRQRFAEMGIIVNPNARVLSENGGEHNQLGWENMGLDVDTAKILSAQMTQSGGNNMTFVFNAFGRGHNASHRAEDYFLFDEAGFAYDYDCIGQRTPFYVNNVEMVCMDDEYYDSVIGECSKCEGINAQNCVDGMIFIPGKGCKPRGDTTQVDEKCKDIDKPIFDAVNRICVACSDEFKCANPWLCKSSGRCVECLTSKDCEHKIPTPVCDPAEDICRQCYTDSECPENKHCSKDGRCVECVIDEHCSDTPRTPICRNEKCTPCQNNGECRTGNKPGPYCALDGEVSGSCVGCLDYTHCTGTPTKPICRSWFCAPCLNDAECKSPGKPGEYCAPSGVRQGRCDECVKNEHCFAAKPICSNGTCRKCKTDEECPEGKYCATLGRREGYCDTCAYNKHCTGGRVCADGQCACAGAKIWVNEQCVCPDNTPQGADTTTCLCPTGQVEYEGKCVPQCPKTIGMTDNRDANGNCLCDTTKGYKELSVDNTFCECDTTRNYFNKPDGTCLTCVQTTKEWAQKRWPDGYVDPNSMVSDVWYCGLMRWDDTYGEKWYNPTTGKYCAYRQLLKKSGNGFYCSDCGAHFTTGAEGGRTTQWGFCGCAWYYKWQNNRCVNQCDDYKKWNVNGKCVCKDDSWTFDGVNCSDTAACNDVPAYQDGSSVFHYDRWVNNTPASCHPGTDRANQSSDPDSLCYYKYGCSYVSSNKVPCSYSTKITKECTCPTGGNVGEYCCSTNQIITETGCQTCTGNTVPNAERNQCVACKVNEIPNDNRTKCVACPDGQVPSATKTTCIACAEHQMPDTTGSVCIDKKYCHTNKDCLTEGDGYYCYMKFGYSCSTEFSNHPEEVEYSGYCRLVENDIIPYKETAPINYFMSDRTMTWWSAERFCSAAGGKMVYANEFACTNTQLGTGGVFGKGKCENSSLMNGLKTSYGNYTGWLANNFGNTCHRYHVTTNSSEIGYGEQDVRSGDIRAVCGCPIDKPYWDGKKCFTCGPTKIWDGYNCICDPKAYELNENGECVCITSSVAEMDLISTAPNAPQNPCVLDLTNLGKLKGTYYFKYVSGTHYFVCPGGNAAVMASFNSYVHRCTTDANGVETCTKGEKLIDVPGNPLLDDNTRQYTPEEFMNLMKNAPIRYFTFDGKSDIKLKFHDSYCLDNCGEVKFELHKVTDLCEVTCTAPRTWKNGACQCPSDKPFEAGGQCYECTKNADCKDSGTPVCDPEEYFCRGCEGDTPYWDPDGQQCVTVCPDTKPKANNENICEACPTDTPHWNGTECVACIDSTDCPNNQQCTNYQCTACPTNLIRNAGKTECHCSSDDMGMTTSNDGQPYCMNWCPKNYKRPGLILIIDHSGSTSLYDRAKYIDTALNALVIPVNDLNTAIYYDVGGGQTKVDNPKPYGKHTYDELSYYFSAENRGYRYTPDNTDFASATKDILENVCVGQKLMIMLWTDAANDLVNRPKTKDYLIGIKEKCPGTKFYYIAPKQEDYFAEVTDKYYDIDSLPEEYTNVLNNEIAKEACILNCTGEKPIEGINGCEPCPTDKPKFNTDTKICEACPTDTPHWNGTECVATCPTDKPYLDETSCVATCPDNKTNVNNICCIDESDSQTCCNAHNLTWYNGECKKVCTEDFIIGGVGAEEQCIACPKENTNGYEEYCETECQFTPDDPIGCCRMVVLDGNHNCVEENVSNITTISSRGVNLTGISGQYNITYISGVVTNSRFTSTPTWTVLPFYLWYQNSVIELPHNNTSSTTQTVVEDANKGLSMQTGSFDGVSNVYIYRNDGPYWTYNGVTDRGCTDNCGQLKYLFAKICPSGTPYWDGSNCVTSCPTNKPKPNTSTKVCEACPSSTPYWDGSSCVATCPTDKPKPNTSTKVCEACPSGTPYWDSSKKICVNCVIDTQCTNGQSCINNECRCAGNKIWDETAGACVCRPELMFDGVDPQTCACYDDMDTVNGQCQLSCQGVGMTGNRNVGGTCLCDTNAGFKALPVNGVCDCDNSRNYFNKPDGTCMTCEEVTVEWLNRNFPPDDYPHVDPNSLVPDIWYCGFNKYDDGEKFYNPTTQQYCDRFDALKKTENGFECFDCGEWEGTTNPGARGTTYGFCGCSFGRTWNGTNCVAPCPTGQLYMYGACTKCSDNHWSFDNGETCYGTLCDGPYSTRKPTDGLYQTGDYVWSINYFRQNAPDCPTPKNGRVWQSLDPNDPCYWEKGCHILEGNLPACPYSSEITSACKCPTGGNVGEYCCSVAQIKTATGCTACTGNTIPNADKTACVPCPDNQIPTLNRTSCQTCPTGQVPSFTKTKCIACGDGYEPDPTQSYCLAKCSDSALYWDGSSCVATCPTNRPKLNTLTKVCEACPSGYHWLNSASDCVNYECYTNDDCADGKYCSWDNGQVCEDTGRTDSVTTSSPDTTIYTSGYFESANNMSYEDAERYCAAIGKRLYGSSTSQMAFAASLNSVSTHSTSETGKDITIQGSVQPLASEYEFWGWIANSENVLYCVEVGRNWVCSEEPANEYTGGGYASPTCVD